MAFELPELGYAYDALEPHIDARTMEIHHTKHHASYTANLNAALAGHADLQGMSAEALVTDLGSLPDGIQTAVRNNGGGFVNHNLFWSCDCARRQQRGHGQRCAQERGGRSLWQLRNL